jgi:hypothetical protein
MKFEQITAGQCATWAATLRNGLAEFQLSVHPTSDVGQMIRELDWLGSFPSEAAQPDAAWAANRDRAKRAFPLVEQAIRIAQSITFAHGISGAHERVRSLRKRVNRLESQDEQAQDILFELEMGARFTHLGLTITFDEPDIVLHTSDGHRLGVACKRPRNRERLRERLRDATAQVTARPDQGVIVIGVEPLFHKSQDPKRPTITYLGEPWMVKAEAERILDDALGSAEKEIAAALNDGVAGILFCGVVTGWARDVAPGRDAYHFQWIHRAISHPDALGLAHVLEQRLFSGEIDAVPVEGR